MEEGTREAVSQKNELFVDFGHLLFQRWNSPPHLVMWLSDSISVDVAIALLDFDHQVLSHQGQFLLVSPLLLMVARPDPAAHQGFSPTLTETVSCLVAKPWP